MATSTTTSFKGKVVAVTGATSGIGKEFVRVFAASGASVVFSGRRADKGKELETEIKSKKQSAVFVQGDVTKQADVDKLVQTAEKEFGGLDYLINNAGVEGSFGPLAEQGDLSNFDKVFDVNVKGILRGYQAAVPLLKKRENSLIVNISSVAAVLPFPNFGVYGASKAAVDAFTRVAAVELAADKIRVYSINPYAFASEMADRASQGNAEKFARIFNPSGKLGNGTDLGHFLIELYEGKHSAQYPPGSNIAIEAGNSNWPIAEVLPKYLANPELAAHAAVESAALVANSGKEN